jgi:hypothetical protein
MEGNMQHICHKHLLPLVKFKLKELLSASLELASKVQWTRTSVEGNGN